MNLFIPPETWLWGPCQELYDYESFMQMKSQTKKVLEKPQVSASLVTLKAGQRFIDLELFYSCPWSESMNKVTSKTLILHK